MSDLGGGNHCQHAVHHPEACPEDWNDRQLFTLYFLNSCLADRRLDFHIFEFQIPGRLIAFQHRDLADGLAELLGSNLLAPDQADLVFDQRVVHNHYLCHFSPPYL